MTLEKLISELQELIRDGLPPGSAVYVPERTNLNGAGWCSPRQVHEGYDPHPISAPYPAPLVVYIHGDRKPADGTRTRTWEPEDNAWLQAHAEDRIEVTLIDLLSIAGRLSDLERDPDGAMAVHRLVTCDLPRLRDYLPERALDEI